MLRAELYVALYLLIGCGFYLFHKKMLDDILEDQEVHSQRFVAFSFVVGWLPIWIMDIFAWCFYNGRALLRYISDRRDL